MQAGVPASAAELIGQQVGKYRITKYLGEGGMAQVFIADHVDASIARQVAIKVVLRELCQNQQIVQRFINEAKALGRITHPGVVDVFDVTQTADGRVCLIMELLKGTTLFDWLHQRGGMSVAEAVPIMLQLADTFAAAHEQKIIHRDIKPDNIYLVPDTLGGQRIKVLDFGIAKLLEGAGQVVTATKSMMGTAAYMPPEQFRSSKYVDHRSDIYALGCVFFEMMSGQPPFGGKTLAEHMHSHNFTPAPTLRSVVPGAPEALEQVIIQMLAKDPDHRHQSMRELVQALQSVGRAEASIAGPMSAPLPAQPQPQPAVATPASNTATHTPTSPATSPGGNTTLFAIAAVVVVVAGCAAAVALL